MSGPATAVHARGESRPRHAQARFSTCRNLTVALGARRRGSRSSSRGRVASRWRPRETRRRGRRQRRRQDGAVEGARSTRLEALPLVGPPGQVAVRGARHLRSRRSRRDAARCAGASPMSAANPDGALDPTLPVGAQIAEKMRAVIPARCTRVAAGARDRAAGAGAHSFRAQQLPRLSVPVHGRHDAARSSSMRSATNPVLLGRRQRHPAARCDRRAAQVIRLMKELADGFDTAVLFVSSSPPVAREACTRRLLVMEAGRIVENDRRPESHRGAVRPHALHHWYGADPEDLGEIRRPPAPPDEGREVVLSLRDAFADLLRSSKRSGFGGFSRGSRDGARRARSTSAAATASPSSAEPAAANRALMRLLLTAGTAELRPDPRARARTSRGSGRGGLLAFRARRCRWCFRIRSARCRRATSVGRMLEDPLKYARLARQRRSAARGSEGDGRRPASPGALCTRSCRCGLERREAAPAQSTWRGRWCWSPRS